MCDSLGVTYVVLTFILHTGKQALLTHNLQFQYGTAISAAKEGDLHLNKPQFVTNNATLHSNAP